MQKEHFPNVIRHGRAQKFALSFPNETMKNDQSFRASRTCFPNLCPPESYNSPSASPHTTPEPIETIRQLGAVIQTYVTPHQQPYHTCVSLHSIFPTPDPISTSPATPNLTATRTPNMVFFFVVLAVAALYWMGGINFTYKDFDEDLHGDLHDIHRER